MPELLIDTDTGIDDAVAIALAARLPSLRVVAITTVHGNTEVARATRNARLVASMASLTVPVIAGAPKPLARPARPARDTHGEEGLGYVRPEQRAVDEPDVAAAIICQAARSNPGLTLCMLGPLTNLAKAVRAEPRLGELVGPVYVMGGTFLVKGTMTEWSEFNWWSDPEAVSVVLRAGLDIRLVPLDVTRRVAVPGTAIAALREAGRSEPEAAFWADALRFYADFHRSHERFDGCVINDALAVALIETPSLATWEEHRITVSCSSDERRGAVQVLPDGSVGEGSLVRVALDVRAREALELVGERLFSRWVAPDVMAGGARDAERWLRENAPARATTR